MLPFGSDSSFSVGCIECMTNWVNVGGYCVANLTLSSYACNVANCEYCVQNNYCGKCQEGYYVQLFTGGKCTKTYSPIPNCMMTTLFSPVCLACSAGYALTNFFACQKMTNLTCNI